MRVSEACIRPLIAVRGRSIILSLGQISSLFTHSRNISPQGCDGATITWVGTLNIVCMAVHPRQVPIQTGQWNDMHMTAIQEARSLPLKAKRILSRLPSCHRITYRFGMPHRDARLLEPRRKSHHIRPPSRAQNANLSRVLITWIQVQGL